ncbi:MFS transporter [Terribacillus saccharophilus]|uniref:Putative proline/betaine transporter n=1 Tax=Terribacillus saccharophilus TaxID=361277 RepID=A0A268A6X9_9BACI|nr:MFS transporter [Terribacillus saccharophilus]PAD19882.1 MFS transporter [Terribacillus saccharophilus]PAF19211.1 MFS transporter [Terribacillus saccharophilus]PAF23028.1 MFS transporter [Terribacillus saccharophilus]PAF36709.1 MFS transporter [Terribacillus saccharophilus]PAF40377.1 MFS transporter [Terribacillus saccharophilus]
MKFNKKKINVVDIQTAKKSVFATGVGNAMEWFDFGLYSYLAVIISQNFFSAVQNDELKLVFTFATFAIAFLMRPVGGIIFGRIGDRLGRKVVLTTTIILMAFSTLLIGLLPTYDQIGIWAPILLLIARIIQGFSTGGEYAGAMVYIAESSPDNKRNILGSGLEIGTLTGYILASLVASLLFIVLSDEQMASWGWRIPFLLGLPLGLVGMYLRKSLEESPIFENELSNNEGQEQVEESFLSILKNHKKDIIVCFVAVAFFNVTNYMLLSYMPSYLDEIIGLSSTVGTVLITLVMIIMVPLTLMFGRLSDKIGNKTVFLIGLGGLTLLSAFAFYLVNLNGLVFVSIGILILGVLLATYEGSIPGSLPTMFYTDIRYRTLSVTFNVSVSIFGGTTPLVSTWLVHQTGNNLAPAWYLTIVSIIGFLVILFLFKSTSGKSLKGSYPTVATKSEFKEAVENPEDALWWKAEEEDNKPV